MMMKSFKDKKENRNEQFEPVKKKYLNQTKKRMKKKRSKYKMDEIVGRQFESDKKRRKRWKKRKGFAEANAK